VIFVTVGSQTPFDRLVRAVDNWAESRGRSDVFAQIGPSDYRPKTIEVVPFLDPSLFRERIKDASVVVAHAGMGVIITALEHGKPIVVMPRRGDLKETRNDHQLATAEQFLKQGRVMVAYNEEELAAKLDSASFQSAEQVCSQASDSLIGAIRNFIEGSIQSRR
jgi:UDP-N-acetylglucosamine transferase subunit ALG13